MTLVAKVVTVFTYLKENVDCNLIDILTTFLICFRNIHRFKNARDNLFFAMDKKELEARYQHKFPGYKPASDLNNKFRDIEVNPKAFKFNSQTTEDSNTYGIALNAA